MANQEASERVEHNIAVIDKLRLKIYSDYNISEVSHFNGNLGRMIVEYTEKFPESLVDICRESYKWQADFSASLRAAHDDWSSIQNDIVYGVYRTQMMKYSWEMLKLVQTKQPEMPIVQTHDALAGILSEQTNDHAAFRADVALKLKQVRSALCLLQFELYESIKSVSDVTPTMDALLQELRSNRFIACYLP